jgi:Sulfotransferase domain
MKNLFIIGAQRSGSTYLYEILDCHPEVSMAQPVRPEPKFFLNELLVSKGKKFYEETYFSSHKLRTRYFGEKSTSYIESADAAMRIKKYYPDARILIILRDPVLRAYSNYRFSVVNNLESLSFEQALAMEATRFATADFSTSVAPFAYLKRGYYIDYIEQYLDVFDSNQVCILIFEEFANNLNKVQDLYRWLGIADNVSPHSLNQVVNPSTMKMESQLPQFRDLALSYTDSISRLEKLLGRKIEIWRDHHHALINGVIN